MASAVTGGSRPARSRPRLVALVLVVVAVAALGCGGGGSSAPSTTASGPHAAFAWLRDKAEPWNHVLNRDQVAVNAAAAASASGISGSQFFSRLNAACSKMQDDTRKAQAIAAAPATTLEHAWSGMLADTANYASTCITLAQTHANQDLTAWNQSLSRMNQANSVFNQAVTVTRNAVQPAAG